jgi:quercetin dioxygenase-like cupin family protein
MLSLVLAAAVAAPAQAASQPAPLRPIPTVVWTAKPATPPPYPSGIKPWIKLADLKAAHAGQRAWRQTVVDDGRLTGEYVAEPPGTNTGRRLHPDTREWFAVMEGDIRVEIEGQEPFTATRGSLVNIPKQTFYALETVGRQPSLRWVVNVGRAKTLYPADAAAAPSEPPGAGATWTRVTVNRIPGQYDSFNRPHLNIHEAAAHNDRYTGGRFVRDDKSEMLVIYGYEKNLPPFDAADKGHFHPESAEFWLVFAGRIRYAFEGQEPFVAGEGDIVYVPANTWHATRFQGEAPACRLSITEYVGNTLLLEPKQ